MQTGHASKKFLQPALPPIFLHRAALIKRLNEAMKGSTSESQERLPDHKLILLYAPAGYGKTTVLTDLARRTTFPFCWYNLDATDSDKLVFLKSLIESLCRQFRFLSEQLEGLSSHIASSTIENVMDAAYIDGIVDNLAEIINRNISERFAFAICDYQEINDISGVNEIIDRILQKVHMHCMIIIESRVIPNLDFAHLLARREVFILNSQDLRFTAQEICNLAALQSIEPLSFAEAEQLARAFDGWITGILLSTQVGGSQFLQIHQNDQHYLFRYVVNEVFQREKDIYHFLKEAVVLQQMTPAVCAELLEISDAEHYLVYLERRGLFVTRHESGAQVVYTCNSVLRHLLSEELQREDQQRFFSLHQRAAQIFLASHEYEQAMYHILQAQAYDMAVKQIFAIYQETFAQGQIEALNRWIQALPATLTAYDPHINLILANIALLTNEYTRAFSFLDAAARELPETFAPGEETTNHALRSSLDLTRSKALFQAGEYQQARDLCERVLERLADDEIPERAEAYIRLGICLNLSGDIPAGISHLQKSLQLWGRNTCNRQVANAHSALASAYSLIGNFVLAEHHLSRSILQWQELHDEQGKITSLIRRGVIKQRQGAFSEAETDLAQALDLARAPVRFQPGEAYALSNLADLALEQEQYERALTFAEDSLELARQLKDHRLATCSLHILAMAYLLKGDPATAQLFASEILLLTHKEKQASYEHAIYNVTYGTILLYQQQYTRASGALIESKRALEAMDLKHEQIQVNVRLAACYLALRENGLFTACLEELTAFLTSHRVYEHLAFLEICRHTALREALEASSFKDLLHPGAEKQPSQKKVLEIQPSEHFTPADTPLFKIVAFGEPTIALKGKSVTQWRMARAMELFFFLLHMGRPTRKEQIITALWPEVDDQTDHTFHTTVYYLRKTIGGTAIHSRASQYSISLDTQDEQQIWYDVRKFQNHQMLARQALEREDDAQARKELQAMIGLYRGDYLQPFYHDWCNASRDNLRCTYLDAQCELARIAWRSKTYEESIFHWQQVLTVDNCLEEAHYGIIRSYMSQGKRSLALRQYQYCRETLQQELGIKPGHVIQNLYQRLLEEST